MKTIREYIDNAYLPNRLGNTDIYTDLSHYILCLNKCMEAVPEQYKNEAMVHIYGKEDYGDVTIYCSIYYDRLMSDEELQAEEAIEEERKNKEIEQAMTVLKKYGKL